MSDKILIVGATGLIGGQLVRRLVELGDDKQLHLLMRRDDASEYGSATIHAVPSEEWPDVIATIKPDKTVSCLGSTMKKAGSKEAFAAIDRDLVGAVAEASKSAGATHFIAVSSTMANSQASSYYLKVKGQAEDALRSCNFDRLDIIRPGLLRGKRTNDPRLGESLAIMASPVMDMLLQGSLRRYRSIDAGEVAQAIAELLNQSEPGEYIHENDQIRELTRDRIIDSRSTVGHSRDCF